MPAPYFKYGVLNSLRDELWLTFTLQKATLFLFLYAGIPAAGLGVAIAHASRSHSLLQTLLFGAAALAIGIGVAWMLPKALWFMLFEFHRRGWFLQPEPPAGIPAISAAEFIKRSDALYREESRHQWFWILGLFTWAIGTWLVLKYTESSNLPDWLQLITALCTGGTFFAGAYLFCRSHRRLVKKHGLECPNCGREILDASGLSRILNMGHCTHCGARIIHE
jgi:hypothetical protein